MPNFGMVLGIAPLEELIRRATAAERGNFEMVCYYDHILYWSLEEKNTFELWTTLTTIAKETSRVKLSPLVTDCLRRHPSITAQSMLTLDHISQGRAVLTLGAGSPINLDPFGIPWEKPVAKLKEAIQIIKLLWTSSARKPANFEGEFFRLENAFLQIETVQKPHPPLYQSAFGPKSRRMAGEISNGFLTQYESPRMLEESLKDVKTGAKDAGKNPDDLNVLIQVYSAVSPDADAARRAVEMPLRQDIASQPFQRKRLGIDDAPPEFKFLDEIRRIGMKGVSHKKLLEVVRRTAEHVPTRIVDELAIFGTPDDCIDKIEKYLQAGAKTVLIENYGPDIMETEKFYAEKIIPYFLE